MNTPLNELRDALHKAKDGKAMGCDQIPIEALKNTEACTFLLEMFNKAWETGLTPVMWRKSIIAPIPKDASKDKRVPLNYRGISLASSVYKLYCAVIDNRLSSWAETYGLINDEQNGFRKNRGCSDHLLSLNNIVDTRKQKRQSTYMCFVDFSKAYDRVNRQLLWIKLEKLGLNGNISRVLKSLYIDYQCCVRLNGFSTDYFSVKCGLKQGCILSPLLFNLYVNDLITSLKVTGKGIPINDHKVCCLAYADDIVIMAENEPDLQLMLNVLHDWCKTWNMKINPEKTKIVHFRPPSKDRTEQKFSCGNDEILLVDKYKYLGLVFNEHLNHNIMAKCVADSANRALGVIIANLKHVVVCHLRYTRNCMMF